MTPEQEHQLVQRAQRDPRAFVHLYDAYFPRIHAYIRYRVSSREDAQDLIADVFVRALRGLPDFQWQRQGAFSAWLFRIAHNRVVDHYRRQDNRVDALELVNDLEEFGSQDPRPDEALAQQETFERIRALTATLSPRRQEVITLRFFGGLRNYEIAQILGLDERTVASHLSRGLQALQRDYRALTESVAVAEEPA